MPEPVDVKQVVLDSLTPLRPLAQEKQVSLETELEEGCVVMATEDDLFHIVFNLEENAIKYNVPGGSVEISLHQDDKQVTPHGLRHGHRHPGGGPGEHLLPLLPGGQGPLPGGRGQRPGTQYCTRRGAGPRGQHRSRSK